MDTITLLSSTGDPSVDRLLRGVIGRFEAAFPARIRCHYLKGSYTDGSAVSTSDLDLAVVFKGTLDGAEEERAARLAEECTLLSPLKLDVDALAEDRLLPKDVRAAAGDGLFVNESVRLKTASLPLYGEDIRDRIPLPPLDLYRRHVTRAPYVNYALVVRDTPTLVFPLAPPDPAGEFYGYDVRRADNQYSPTGVGTKDLVASVGWTATALVALHAGRYVGRKSDSLALYRECIGDEWAGFIGEIFARCRDAWAYLIPADPADRRLLRDLCARMPAFENHYLARYRDYLLDRLRRGDADDRLFAARRLGEVVYTDAETRAALRAIDPGDNGALRAAIRDALQGIVAAQRA